MSKLYSNSPFIKDVMKFFSGRTFNAQNRAAKDMSPRPGPQPNLPPGCHSALSNNFYYQHDARRLAKEPISIDTSKLLIADKQGTKAAEPASVAPGTVYNAPEVDPPPTFEKSTS